jgi:hypothetical protein
MSGSLFEISRAEISLSTNVPFHDSEDRKSGSKGNSEIDQTIVDEIGVESTDSESGLDEVLPAPSLYTQSQARDSSLSRSKSIGSLLSFGTCESSVQDFDCYSGAKFCAGTTVMFSPKRFATGIESTQPESLLGGGLRRSSSMSCIQKTRSDYNRAVGEALANSPKKATINTAEDMAFIEKILSEL